MPDALPPTSTSLMDERRGSRCFLNYHRIVFAHGAEPALRQLIDEYRVRCLWFLREDYYPTTAAECERVFAWIERHGDVEAFRRVAAMRAWLSHRFNETSVGS